MNESLEGLNKAIFPSTRRPPNIVQNSSNLSIENYPDKSMRKGENQRREMFSTSIRKKSFIESEEYVDFTNKQVSQTIE